MGDKPLILGTRGSALALWQANHIRSLLGTRGRRVELEVITTTGDLRLDVPFAAIGEKGLFTREIDAALLSGAVDLAVHSLKDLPSEMPDGLALSAAPERAAPWDAFVAHPTFEGGITAVPEGAIVATSSLRRSAQLKAWRSDLQIVPVRGNVDTRLRKLDEGPWHGIVLAEAGLMRLGLDERIRERVPLELMLPAVGQGALGVVCAARNRVLSEWLRDVLHHEATGYAVTAERAFLRRLEGGCSIPVGAYATVEEEFVRVRGCIVSLDGSRVVRDEAVAPLSDASDVGRELAETLLSRGGATILADIRAENG